MKKAIQNNKKGYNLMELIVVIIIIGVLVAMAVPKYLDHKKQADLAVIKNDSKVVGDFALSYKLEHDKIPPNKPTEIQLIKESIKKDKVYYNGDPLNDTELIDIKGGEFYELDINYVRKKTNTVLKGKFIIDSEFNVFYVEDKVITGAESDSNNLSDYEKDLLAGTDGYIYDERKKAIVGYDVDVGGELPEDLFVPGTLIRNGEDKKVVNVNYEFDNHNLKSIRFSDDIESIYLISGEGNNLEYIHIGHSCTFAPRIRGVENHTIYYGKNVRIELEQETPEHVLTDLSKMRTAGGYVDARVVKSENIAKKFIIDEGNKHIKFENGFLFSKDGNTLYSITQGSIDSNGIVKLPEGPKFVNFNSFPLNSNSIKKLELPRSLEYIPNGGLSFNNQISELTLRENVRYLGDEFINLDSKNRNQIKRINIESSQIIGGYSSLISAEEVFFNGNEEDIIVNSRLRNAVFAGKKMPYGQSLFVEDKGYLLGPIDRSDNYLLPATITKNNKEYPVKTVGHYAFDGYFSYFDTINIEAEPEDIVILEDAFPKDLLKTYMENGAGIYRKEGIVWKKLK